MSIGPPVRHRQQTPGAGGWGDGLEGAALATPGLRLWPPDLWNLVAAALGRKQSLLKVLCTFLSEQRGALENLSSAETSGMMQSPSSAI